MEWLQCSYFSAYIYSLRPTNFPTDLFNQLSTYLPGSTSNEVDKLNRLLLILMEMSEYYFSAKPIQLKFTRDFHFYFTHHYYKSCPWSFSVLVFFATVSYLSTADSIPWLWNTSYLCITEACKFPVYGKILISKGPRMNSGVGVELLKWNGFCNCIE